MARQSQSIPDAFPETPGLPEDLDLSDLEENWRREEAEAAAKKAAALAAQTPPTLTEAFHTLCRAMSPLLEDNLTSQLHCDEIRGWMDNGNTVVSWNHAMLLLEEILGTELLRR